MKTTNRSTQIVSMLSSFFALSAIVLIFSARSVPAQTTESNVALGKQTRQSSTKFGENAAAQVAVDGNTKGNWAWDATNSVTHTQETPNPWWEVDLGAVYDISSIKIWNRTDCCVERLDGMRILVGETPIQANDTRVFASERSFGPGDSRVFTSQQNTRGRYVRVALDRRQVLSLAEVEVFGTPANSSASTNTLIAANSVGDIRLGMTVGEARRAMDYAMFEGNSDTDNYRVLVRDKLVMTLTPAQTYNVDDDGNATPLNDTAKIDSIAVFDSQYRAANGIHPGMKINEAENIYGRPKLSWDPEGGESLRFANQPTYLGFNLSGQNRVGVYRANGNLVPENDFGDLSKGFETSVYAPGAEIDSITVMNTSEAESTDGNTDFLITASSAGKVRLGMAVSDVRKIMSGAVLTKFDGVSIWDTSSINVTRGDDVIIRLHGGDDFLVDDVNENAKIKYLTIFDSRYRTPQGVHPGMAISEAEKIYGKLPHINMGYGIESGEFSNQLKGLTFLFEGKGNSTAGSYDGEVNLRDDLTNKYNSGSYISGIRITGIDETGSSDDEMNYLLTETSAGDIRLGMTVAEARKVFKGAKFEQYDSGEEGVAIEVTRGEKNLITLATNQEDLTSNNEGLVPIDDAAEIISIEISDTRYRSTDGVHPGMTVSEAEKKFGKIKQIFYSGLDDNEAATFLSQPKTYSFDLGVTDPGADYETKAGIYPGDEVFTTRYTAAAVISTITISVASDNEDATILAKENEVPTETQLQVLVRSTLMRFNDAVGAKDFTSFRDSVAKPWKDTSKTSDFNMGFTEFLDKEIDISSIRDIDAKFSPTPYIAEKYGKQVLFVKGIYETSPLPVNFNLEYIVENEEWKMVFIGVDTRRK